MPNYKQDCGKAESCCSLAGIRANEKRQPLHMCRGSWYGLHQYEATNQKKSCGNMLETRARLGNAAYVTYVTLM